MAQLTIALVSSKSLSAPRAEAARLFAERLVTERFEGNVNAAAKKLEVSQSQLSDFINKKGGGGLKVLEALADLARVPIDVVIGRGLPSASELPVIPRDRALHRLRGVIDPQVDKMIRAIDDRGQTEIAWMTVALARQRELDDGMLVFPDASQVAPAPPSTRQVKPIDAPRLPAGEIAAVSAKSRKKKAQ